ncbi:hypothetical protein A0O34_15020 [Chryseobacterium glaciei]|uniref:Uncharacterized protein n=1 Tax=Chryseobacterium glaciei TaxID=1685010 RepID=A0A172XY39_9FLAO|nr:hypothetical protein [Chryseobacterium glaciei]ANF51735.1 hypothetical protein A0O34_15020 [Chryseobacterium glaciei]
MKFFLKTKGTFATGVATFFMIEIILLAMHGYCDVVNSVIKYPAIFNYENSNKLVFTLSRLTSWLYVIFGGFTFISIVTFLSLGKYSISKEN